MVVAPVAAGREAALRALLDTMNAEPGDGRPGATRVAAVRRSSSGCTSRASRCSTTRPAADLDALRPAAAEALPTYLAFIGDCDGPGRRGAGRARAARRRRACAASSRTAKASTPRRRPARLDARARAAGRPRATSTGSAAPCGRSARRARCSARSRRGCRAALAAPGDPPSACARELAAFVAAEVGSRPAGADAARADAARLAARASSLQPRARAARRHRRCCRLLIVAAPLFVCPAAHAARSATPRSARARRAADLAALQRARGPRRHEPVHGARRRQAGLVPALAADRRCWC